MINVADWGTGVSSNCTVVLLSVGQCVFALASECAVEPWANANPQPKIFDLIEAMLVGLDMHSQRYVASGSFL